MDTDYAIDLEAVFEVIDKAEVITFRFVTVSPRLLFDTRHTEMDGPLLKTIPRATSLEDRFRALKQLRPRFKIPDRITAIWWPKYARSLQDSGVWERIQHRLSQEGYPQLADSAEAVLMDICHQERVETQHAITGAGYHALWERKA